MWPQPWGRAGGGIQNRGEEGGWLPKTQNRSVQSLQRYAHCALIVDSDSTPLCQRGLSSGKLVGIRSCGESFGPRVCLRPHVDFVARFASSRLRSRRWSGSVRSSFESTIDALFPLPLQSKGHPWKERHYRQWSISKSMARWTRICLREWHHAGQGKRGWPEERIHPGNPRSIPKAGSHLTREPCRFQ